MVCGDERPLMIVMRVGDLFRIYLSFGRCSTYQFMPQVTERRGSN